ncbi:unnamed protein product [Clonostachys rhizophaga]|uniref:Uncharacterized protein n=1 Tax=Clonostachys rhizophaga TaxID=160324 RepID=A0A9N9W587_9HYPO|nr:unnamed protein product [Clonostachys rhizophaga]
MAGASTSNAKGSGLFSRELTEVLFGQGIHRAGSSLDSEKSKATNRVVITLIPGINAGALQILQTAWWV